MKREFILFIMSLLINFGFGSDKYPRDPEYNGCCETFWKLNSSKWRVVKPKDVFDDVFNVNVFGKEISLMDLLETNGYHYEFYLARSGIAGLLNAYNEKINYEYEVDTVIDIVRLSIVNKDWIYGADILDFANKVSGCPFIKI